MEVCFFDTLAMIALGITQAEESFLQEIVLLVPERKSHVLQTMSVTDTCDAILAPSVCSRPRLVMGEVTPCIAVLRVVLTDRCPLTLRNIRAPFFPVLLAFSVVFETLLFLAEVLVMINHHHVVGVVLGVKTEDRGLFPNRHYCKLILLLLGYQPRRIGQLLYFSTAESGGEKGIRSCSKSKRKQTGQIPCRQPSKNDYKKLVSGGMGRSASEKKSAYRLIGAA